VRVRAPRFAAFADVFRFFAMPLSYLPAVALAEADCPAFLPSDFCLLISDF